MLFRNLKLVLLLAHCLFITICAAQSTPDDFISVKNFTPPSPEAAALGRYGEIPTDPSTGVPQISVPLYEIKSGKLSVPISLSYHASGIKVNDVATPVGLGWVLNAGGEVSRCIIGKADEVGLLAYYGTVYKSRAELVGQQFGNGDQYSAMENFAHGNFDTQSDNYFFSVGDVSGKFVYDTGHNMHISPQDRQPKVIWNYDSTFTITDDAGTIYYFTTKERTANSINSEYYVTTWHITKIISPDLADSINFYYQTATIFSDTSQSNAYTIQVNDDQSVKCANAEPTVTFGSSQNICTHERKLIDSIRFSNGYVKFTYVNDRLDMLPERLSAVRIGNLDGVIKEIELKQSYFYSVELVDTPAVQKFITRLRLDTVKFNNKNSQPVNNYNFQYNNKILPSYRCLADGGINNEADFWGYYNGSGAGGYYKTTIPANYENHIYSFLADNYYAVSNSILQEYRNRSSNKYPDPSLMDGCMLKRINYPTGGYTAFEFEANQITGNGELTDYRGGLRVSKIISFDTVNRQPMVKTYTYDSAVSISNEYAGDFQYITTNIVFNIALGMEYYCFKPGFHISANPTNAIGYFNGSPVIYQQVTEYNGFPGYNNGKTVYRYECTGDSSYNDPNMYKYWNYSTDKSWARGNLLSKKIYKNENDSLILIKETRNYYTDLAQESIKTGIVCDRYIAREGSFTGDLSLYMLDSLEFGLSWRWLLSYYEYFDVRLSSGLKKLIKTEEIDYLDHDLTNTKEFFYESPYHLYPTRTTSLTSRNADTLVTVLTYPQDRTSVYVPYPASAALTDMVSHNILNTPFETEQYRNDATGNHTISINRTDYKNWHGSNRFYEEYRYSQGEPRIQYKEFDTAGNPTRLSQYNGTDIAYVWSYDHAYPTAQVTNANDSGIAYTSFETNDNGNWGVSSGNSTTAFTGTRGLDLTSTSISKYNLPSGKYYLVTYWSHAGSATVNSGSGTSIKTKNGWTLYKHRLSNSTTSITITGSVVIDELRLYPEDAQMTSYAYKPLVGIVSADNVNDIISYYEYDDFGRLKTIRDYDKNILKTIDYSYNIAQGAGVNGWKWTDTIGGQVINSHYTGIFTKKERDLNSASPTYNQTRWVPFDLGGSDISEWVATDSVRCVKNYLNENTGEQEGEFIDSNPFSTKYGKKKWAFIGYNETDCPTPCTGPAKKMMYPGFPDAPFCETSLKHYTGSYYAYGHWICIYHYEWSDRTESEDYEEYTNDVCPEDE